jgi:hypothetical protein
LYGHNDFRFLGKNGVPVSTYDEGIYGENWNPSCWWHVHEIHERMSFPYSPKVARFRKRYQRLAFEPAWWMLAWKLTTAYSLKHITFVVSNKAQFFDSRSRTRALSAVDDLIAAKSSVEMHVVRMMGEGNDMTSLHDDHRKIILELLCIIIQQPAFPSTFSSVDYAFYCSSIITIMTLPTARPVRHGRMHSAYVISKTKT